MDAQRTGAYLAMLRKTRGMTQQEIADELGITQVAVTQCMSRAIKTLKKKF